MIELRHLEKRFGGRALLQDVNAFIRDGDVIAVIGPSGAGKSTLLRCINLLEAPTGGQILVDGEDITAPGCDVPRVRQRMGMVFQSFNLFGHLTVIENVMLAPMDILRRSKQEAYDTGMALLRRVGMADRAMRYPDALSGGQKQRVAIARALAMDPAILLLDEPTSSLDPTMTGEVQAVIRDLAQSGKTMMIVTHDMDFARSICSRVFYMDEGGLYEDGTPEQIFEAPRREKTRRFIRGLKVLELFIESQDYDFIGAGAEIDQYCLRNHVPSHGAYRIRLSFEELVQQILLPVLPAPRIRVALAYAEAEARASVTVTYNGEPFDPADSDNGLSYRLLANAAADLRYEPSAEEPGYTNTIRFDIRAGE